MHEADQMANCRGLHLPQLIEDFLGIWFLEEFHQAREGLRKALGGQIVFRIGKWILSELAPNPGDERLGLGDGLRRNLAILILSSSLFGDCFEVFLVFGKVAGFRERPATAWRPSSCS